MNDIAEAMTTNLFVEVRFGWEHTGRLLHLLEWADVEFTGCSYSDTRGEYDITFVFEDVTYRLIGGVNRLEFHSVDKTPGCGWSIREPPNVETIAYRMVARLRGEKIDYDHILPGMPFSWYGKGEAWPWREGPDCKREYDEYWLPSQNDPRLGPRSMKKGVLLDRVKMQKETLNKLRRYIDLAALQASVAHPQGWRRDGGREQLWQEFVEAVHEERIRQEC